MIDIVLITVVHSSTGLDFEFINDGFDFFELWSFVGVSVPADVNDPLEVVVDGTGNNRSSQFPRNL